MTSHDDLEPKSGRGRHILLVEDNSDSREVLGMLLEMWGHRVDVAEDGRRAVRKAIDLRPELALIDIGLPEMDGYEVARRIRSDAAGKSMRLVALTGYGQPDDRARAIEHGFDAHLVKPVDPERLARVIATLE
jgi:CheY-like chemotaxis protein